MPETRLAAGEAAAPPAAAAPRDRGSGDQPEFADLVARLATEGKKPFDWLVAPRTAR